MRISLAASARCRGSGARRSFVRFLRQKLIMSRRQRRQRFFSLLYDLALRRSLQAAQLFSVSVFFTGWLVPRSVHCNAREEMSVMMQGQIS